MNWENIDPNMVAQKIPAAEELSWYDPSEAPFEVRGLYWYPREKKLQRFPEASFPMLEKKAPGVAFLARNPTGGQIAFETNATRIAVAAKLVSGQTMYHFAATGEMGIDCYLAYPGEDYRFEGITSFNGHEDSYASEVIKGRGSEHKRVILNLPLYKTVLSLKIGLPKDAEVFAPRPPVSQAPIVFYGTSITQGGCATRPGMLYTNILSRRMNRLFLNYGFSGSGRGEPEVADLLAGIENPALYALIYEANAGLKMEETLKPFIAVLRKTHPVTPILVVSRVFVQSEEHVPENKAVRDRLRAFQKAAVEELSAEGDRHLRFVDGRDLLPTDAHECFVDGVHPTDFGFWQLANSFEPILNECL